MFPLLNRMTSYRLDTSCSSSADEERSPRFPDQFDPRQLKTPTTIVSLKSLKPPHP